MKKTFLITGAAGFIGFHLSSFLLQNGHEVIGVDSISDYYDVNLKYTRLSILKNHHNFKFYKYDISRTDFIERMAHDAIDIIIHLAAQAGVRYSIENPMEYLNTNIVGTFQVLELARTKNVAHLLCASTSSVYGSNKILPFDELQKCDTPMSFYAATKKSNEVMAHSYSHIHDIPVTMFRFFTVYGPWGRPDMALFKFAKAMKDNQPIEVYNNGDMKRDFTYVLDLVNAISQLVDCTPIIGKAVCSTDSISDVAPFRTVNIGNDQPVNLMTYIEALEKALGVEAKKRYLPMQMGDVPATHANTVLLKKLTGFTPKTNVTDGVSEFVRWFEDYYKN